jgi:hypothetical protein
MLFAGDQHLGIGPGVAQALEQVSELKLHQQPPLA